MSALLLVLIIFGCLILMGLGMYFGMQKKDEGEKKPDMFDSGMYSLLRTSPRDNIHKVKPSGEEVLEWLKSNQPDMDEAQAQKLADQWADALEHSLSVVETGDKDGRDTYRFELSEKDQRVLDFIRPDSYITRETIYNHPELLPPFYIGCEAHIEWKEADSEVIHSMASKAGWQPLLPVNGKYPLPDWRTIEL